MSLDRVRRRFSSSTKLATEGVWVSVDLGDGGKPASFLIAQMGRKNKKWYDRSSASFSENLGKEQRGTEERTKSYARILKIFTETVLLNWDLEDGQGNSLPYTPEDGFELLFDCDNLYDILWEEANNLRNFQEKAVKETVGNSQSSSSGS